MSAGTPLEGEVEEWEYARSRSYSPDLYFTAAQSLLEVRIRSVGFITEPTVSNYMALELRITLVQSLASPPLLDNIRPSSWFLRPFSIPSPQTTTVPSLT
jgi:hypothetical protein